MELLYAYNSFRGLFKLHFAQFSFQKKTCRNLEDTNLVIEKILYRHAARVMLSRTEETEKSKDQGKIIKWTSCHSGNYSAFAANLPKRLTLLFILLLFSTS